MIRKLVLGVTLMRGMLAVGVGAAMYVGVDPITERPDTDEPITDFPTATPGGANSIGERFPKPFSFTIDRIDECDRRAAT